jgi:5-(carboxyamino)imidazole ribonucleotide synthase
VGVIGGGQLGLMLGEAAHRLGVRCRFLDPAPDACARAVGELLVAAYDDPAALARLAHEADVVTFEFENVPVEPIRALRTVPGARTLEQGQDRRREKELFARLGIPTARFGTLGDTGVPALVKKRRLGYDGKGQRLAGEVTELADDELAEELVAFDRELSIISVRGLDGDTRFWPVVENTHAGGILRISRAPAAGAPQAEAERIARLLLDELDYAGVLAVELFDVGGRLLANEFAPRVHNSGHWTIEGAVTSQFENHLRAVLGLPLGPTDLVAPSVMVNLIGYLPPVDRLLELPGVHVHVYGKALRPGRKVGHATAVGCEQRVVAEMIRLAEAAYVEPPSGGGVSVASADAALDHYAAGRAAPPPRAPHEHPLPGTREQHRPADREGDRDALTDLHTGVIGTAAERDEQGPAVTPLAARTPRSTR